MLVKNILFTGGSGVLGKEMQKLYLNSLFPKSHEFNVKDILSMDRYLTNISEKIDTLVHMAAFTAPAKSEKNPEEAIAVNIEGTANIVKLCMRNKMRLVYISTDYVFDGKVSNSKEDDPVLPTNKYAWSKLGGECAVQLYSNSIIVRLSFGPNEFPYDKAFSNQWTSREKVSNIAPKLKKVIDSFIVGTIHIGGKRQTVYDYAKSVSPEKDITRISIKDMGWNFPEDTSLSTLKYESLFGGNE
jgi:dTDP-4-dehydrorhamnose reductase